MDELTNRESLIWVRRADGPTNCDDECYQPATYMAALYIPDDTTGDDDTTIEYYCTAHACRILPMLPRLSGRRF